MAAHGGALDCAVVRQILPGDQAVSGLHCSDNTLCDFAAVKRLGALVGDLAQRPGQVRLAPGVADLVGDAIRFEEQAQRLRIVAQALAPVASS